MEVKMKSVLLTVVSCAVTAAAVNGLVRYGIHSGHSTGVAAGYERGFEHGKHRGQNDLAHELIIGCIEASMDGKTCTLSYDTNGELPTIVAIGDKVIIPKNP